MNGFRTDSDGLKNYLTLAKVRAKIRSEVLTADVLKVGPHDVSVRHALKRHGIDFLCRGGGIVIRGEARRKIFII